VHSAYLDRFIQKICVADPHQFDVDPDPTFDFDADLDPDPTSQLDADRILQLTFFQIWKPPMLQNGPLRLQPFYFDADPDPDPAFHFDMDLDPVPTFHSDADPDPDLASQNDADLER
jgi:hypothetical protein